MLENYSGTRFCTLKTGIARFSIGFRLKVFCLCWRNHYKLHNGAKKENGH